MSVTPYSQIPINRNLSTALYASPLYNAVTQLNAAIAQLQYLSNKMGTMVVNNGDGTNNYNQIEAQFGLTATGTDTGSTGYSAKYLVNAAMTQLANGSITALVNQVG